MSNEVEAVNPTYLDDMRRFSLLTPEQELELAREMDQARQRLVAAVLSTELGAATMARLARRLVDGRVRPRELRFSPPVQDEADDGPTLLEAVPELARRSRELVRLQRGRDRTVKARLARRRAQLVDLFFEEIRAALATGEQVKLSGFGNFDLRDKNQRPGRNPKTGEEIPISARRVVTFRPGQKLKARVEAYAGTKPQ